MVDHLQNPDHPPPPEIYSQAEVYQIINPLVPDTPQAGYKNPLIPSGTRGRKATVPVVPPF